MTFKDRSDELVSERGRGHHFYFRQWHFSMKFKFPSHPSPVSASKCAGTMKTSCRNKIMKRKKNEEAREMTKEDGREGGRGWWRGKKRRGEGKEGTRRGGREEWEGGVGWGRGNRKVLQAKEMFGRDKAPSPSLWIDSSLIK